MRLASLPGEVKVKAKPAIKLTRRHRFVVAHFVRFWWQNYGGPAPPQNVVLASMPYFFCRPVLSPAVEGQRNNRKWTEVRVFSGGQRTVLLVVLSLAILAAGLLSSLGPSSSNDTYLTAVSALQATEKRQDRRDIKPLPSSFSFDPNIVTAAELRRLGLNEKQASGWLKFRGDRLNAFKKTADIRKLRMLSAEQKERLVKLAIVKKRARPQVQSFRFNPNTVDANQLQQLGLEAWRAGAYVKYRTKIDDGFSRPEQLERLPFLEPDQVDKLVALADFPLPPKLKLDDHFRFDPNTISGDSLQLLGFPEWQVNAFLKFRGDRRTTFRRAEDLRRVSVLDSNLVTLALPLIDIAPFPTNPAPAASIKIYTPPPPLASVDINTTDTTLLKSIPGIGSYYAKRLVRFRDLLGGFSSLEQVATTRSLPDSTYQKMEPYLQLGPVFRLIELNQASEEDLYSHPYINRKLARIVVRYREQHGPFTGPEDLGGIRILKEETLNQLLPYLSFEQP